MSFVLVIASFFLAVAMSEHAGIDLSWSQWFLTLLALLVVLALLDVRISTRVQLVLAPARRRRGAAPGARDHVRRR